MEVYRSTLSGAIRHTPTSVYHYRRIPTDHAKKVLIGVGMHTREISSTGAASRPSQVGGHVVWIKGAMNVWIHIYP